MLYIIYSAVLACVVEVFLITNIDMLVEYMQSAGNGDSLLVTFFTSGTLTVIFYVIIGIIIFSAAFMLLQRRSFKYIDTIADSVRNIAEGDLNTDVEVEGDDEFSEIAADLNRMEEDIRDLMDRERESERTKNELITNVAHDLRTPLTSVIGYLELLKDNVAKDPETQHKYIEIAYTKAEHLEDLIEELFGFTKMNYGKMAMKIERIDIVKLLGQLLEEFYPSFADAGLTYELISNVPAMMITADGNLLARLFDNLINNAIKYGKDGKKVIVRIDADDEIVTVSVTNYGYVIPKEELPLIFEKFYRVEQSRSSQTGGTGLGLAIAKSIVDMHQGTISVTSDRNGTVFTVRLQVNLDVNRENFRAIG